MGKASKWFRGLFGLKKSSSSSSSSYFSNDTDHIKKRRWSFVKSYREKEEEEEQQQQRRHQNDKPKPVVSDPPPDKNDTEKHAIAVAAASAAAAEAAAVAAHAAAAVVRLTGRAAGIREDWAAVRIQSAFRGCLARKALRALKGLVKLQALVRGHIERKRTTEWLHRMQVMMQAQARAIVGRSELTKPHNPFAHHPPKPVVSDPPPDKNDTEKHAIAVAAASAAAAEAAVVAAHAAAAVVRLTSRAAGIREDWAAVRIQSAFRGCLARKALRALKGLVKLQALVRGHIERKRTAEWLHRMQVMMQAQARAIVGRSELAKPHNPFAHYPGPSTPEKVEHVIRSRSRKYDQSLLLRRNSLRSSGRATSDDRSGNNNNYSMSYSETKTADDEKSDKIVEIDTAKPRRRNLFHSSDDHEAQSSLMFWGPPGPNNDADPEKEEEEKASFCTADNSPQFYSALSSRAGPGGSRRSPFTPSKSDGSASFLSGYSDCPNYMTCTESSKAKARSASAPKQRPNYERSGSAKRYPSAHHGGGAGEPRLRISAALHASFVNKAYPGSGQLDKLGMPIGYRY